MHDKSACGIHLEGCNLNTSNSTELEENGLQSALPFVERCWKRVVLNTAPCYLSMKQTEMSCLYPGIIGVTNSMNCLFMIYAEADY